MTRRRPALNPSQFPMQLPMFASPNDLAGVRLNELGEMDHKLRAANRTGITDSIRERGVVTPIALEHNADEPAPTIVNGHHRFAAQRDVDPDRLMPLMHYNGVRGRALGSNPPSWGSTAMETRSESTFELEDRIAREHDLPDSHYRPARGY